MKSGLVEALLWPEHCLQVPFALRRHFPSSRWKGSPGSAGGSALTPSSQSHQKIEFLPSSSTVTSLHLLPLR
ncbi:hypothetical protein BT69DRAFT_1284639 [Atractiella rhizophila]|nr:hypothetical protein BT69DRAFT_1284639 [Atractiella rhizophila]